MAFYVFAHLPHQHFLSCPFAAGCSCISLRDSVAAVFSVACWAQLMLCSIHTLFNGISTRPLVLQQPVRSGKILKEEHKCENTVLLNRTGWNSCMKHTCWQVSHLYGFSPLWVLLCLSMWYFWIKRMLHWSQLNGFSPGNQTMHKRKIKLRTKTNLVCKFYNKNRSGCEAWSTSC